MRPQPPDLDPFDGVPLIAEGLVDRVESFATLTSTNDYLREAAPRLARHERILVIAEKQTAGRGRGANRWWTGPGSLAFSLLFCPASRGIERVSYPLVSLAAAIAVSETASVATGRDDVGLHWPNDVFIGERKLAGVLIEAMPDGRLVVGIGCNVNNRLSEAPPELAARVISLADCTARPHARGDIVASILRRLAVWLDALGSQPALVGRRANELCLQHGWRLMVRAGTHETTGAWRASPMTALCYSIRPTAAARVTQVYWSRLE